MCFLVNRRRVDVNQLSPPLPEVAKSIVASAEEQALKDARRAAATQERDADLCEEDRRFMAERARQQGADMEAETFKPKDPTDAATKDAADEEAKGSVNSLRDKIKSLQLQLRVQHIQALQSLNSEARTMQKQLQQQLKEMVDQAVRDEVNQSTQTPPAARQTKEVSVQSEGVCKPAALPLQASLLSLLADFVDASCNGFREDLEACAAQEQPDQLRERARSLLIDHIGWMAALNLGTSGVVSSAAETVPDSVISQVEPITVVKPESRPELVREPSRMSDIDEEIAPDANAEPTEGKHTATPEDPVDSSHEQLPQANEGTAKSSSAADTTPTSPRSRPQLALLPDYRSKILWMSALVDCVSVRSIIAELRVRLCDITKKSISTEALLSSRRLPTDFKLEAVVDPVEQLVLPVTVSADEPADWIGLAVGQLCDGVLEGVGRAADEVAQP